MLATPWAAVMPRQIFSRVTGLDCFPEILQARVIEGALHYRCNAALSYRLRGIPVEIETLWGLEEPAGSGDLHRAIMRGSKAELIVDQGPEPGFLTTLIVNPVEAGQAFSAALTDTVAAMQTEFPGLGI